ncbi:MAG: DUF1837 domain-containing protein [Phycisphaerae bacterium]|nr:DUF1837 domain-containing protein [Phycisphaerae bacterium]
MAKHFFREWMDRQQPEPKLPDFVVMREKKGATEAVRAALRSAALDHLVGLALIERMGDLPETAAFIRNKIPTGTRTRSGDLGEILASEYIDQCTEFTVPIKRLRWKDDRETTMRGNDVIALCKRSEHFAILKAESKSRATLGESVITEAIEGLEKHSGRPNPSSLAFISARLREQARDAEAAIFEGLQRRPPRKGALEHLVFTFSGNDAAAHLRKHAQVKRGAIRRHVVGCVVERHQDFIKATFEDLDATAR